ncbi:MAG: DUF4845 domain-containing protein [Rhodocyclaceae bacterium]|nr:DUF4845 domain-containing protein [Rhodocyclaceae bacterium]
MTERERGLTLMGLLVVLLVFGAIALLSMRMMPAIVEYWQIKKALAAIVKDPTAKESPAALRKAFERHAVVSDIRSISAHDLEIRQEQGRWVVSFAYEKRVPLAGNVSLLFDFQGSMRED